MNRHKSFIKGALTGALIMLFAVGVCTKVPELSGLLLQKDSVTAKQERAEKKTEAKFKKIEKMIDQYYLYSDDVKQEDLEDAVYAGFLSALNDPYTVYYNEEETKEIKESTSGEYSGIGAAMMQNVQTGEITITTVYEDSPAEKAGLLEGDILYQVDDHKIEDQDTSEVVSWIKGEEGTEVKLSVYRGEDREEHTLTAVREKIQSQTVEHEMKEDKIGYISVQGFEDVTYEQFKSALEDLEAQGMEGLVIDLRNNPGGNLDTVVEMLKLILPEGRIVSIKDKYGNEETYDCDGKHEFQKPLAVLVNGYSASASEIFAMFRCFIRFKFCPFTMIVPSVGSSSFMIRRINVDFPEPLSPTIKTNSPCSILTDTPFNAAFPLEYSFVTSLNSIIMLLLIIHTLSDEVRPPQAYIAGCPDGYTLSGVNPPA